MLELEVPAIAFYIATGALVVVCVFISIFLFYLIRAVRTALSFAAFLETEARRAVGSVRRIRRAFAVATAFFG